MSVPSDELEKIINNLNEDNKIVAQVFCPGFLKSN
jgi:hypothetical protein